MSSTHSIISLLLSALLLSALRCADYPVAPRPHSLDYLEFHDPSGWVLHIDGDGGGRLIRRQLPGRRVIYLPATFRWQQSARRISRCHETISITSPSCSRAVYFLQADNETRVCQCPEGFWVKQYFEQAFEEMRRSPGERRDRRMLKRAWLREPPMAVLEGE